MKHNSCWKWAWNAQFYAELEELCLAPPPHLLAQNFHSNEEKTEQKWMELKIWNLRSAHICKVITGVQLSASIYTLSNAKTLLTKK